jgi:hypothetical protein
MINVTLSTELATLLHQHEDITITPYKKKYFGLLNWLTQHNGTLTPTFPAIADESMQQFFNLQTTEDISDAALKKLVTLHGVTGAYRKPEEGLPT